MSDFKLLINGRLVEGAGTLDVINPATGRTLTVARRVERALLPGCFHVRINQGENLVLAHFWK